MDDKLPYCSSYPLWPSVPVLSNKIHLCCWCVAFRLKEWRKLLWGRELAGVKKEQPLISLKVSCGVIEQDSYCKDPCVILQVHVGASELQPPWSVCIDLADVLCNVEWRAGPAIKHPVSSAPWSSAHLRSSRASESGSSAALSGARRAALRFSIR